MISLYVYKEMRVWFLYMFYILTFSIMKTAIAIVGIYVHKTCQMIGPLEQFYFLK